MVKFVETESKHVKRVAAHVCDVLCVFCVYCCWIFAPHSVVHWVHWIRVLSVRLQRQQWNPAFSSPSWASRSFCCIPDQGCGPRRITCRFRPGHGWVILSPKSHQGLPNSKRKWRRTFCEQLLLSTDLVSVKVLLKTTWQLVPFDFGSFPSTGFGWFLCCHSLSLAQSVESKTFFSSRTTRHFLNHLTTAAQLYTSFWPTGNGFAQSKALGTASKLHVGNFLFLASEGSPRILLLKALIMSDNATAKTATREFCSASLPGASRHLAWGVTRFDTEVCDRLLSQSAKASVSYKYKACLEDTRQEAARWLDGSLLGVPITRVHSHEHKRWPLESLERLESLSHEVHSDNSKALLITCPCSVNVSTMWRKQKWPRQHSESPSAHSKLSRKDQAKYPHTSAELIWKIILKGVLKNLTMCILHSFTHLPCDSTCLSLHVWPLRIRPLHHAQPQRGQRSSEPWSCAEVYLRSKRSHLVHSTFSGLKNRTRSESSNVASKLFCLCKLLLKLAGKHITGCWHHHKGCRLARTQTQGGKIGRKQKHKEFKSPNGMR